MNTISAETITEISAEKKWSEGRCNTEEIKKRKINKHIKKGVQITRQKIQTREKNKKWEIQRKEGGKKETNKRANVKFSS
jgi:hypothetical protein